MAIPTPTLVSNLKTEGQDFEWYPTTTKMIETIAAHLRKKHQNPHSESNEINVDILDAGAGDGRVLTLLAGEHGKKYAIEKSTILINQQPNDVIPVGTDFHATTLIDKKVDAVFCNPPYSEYEQWSKKIIREANTSDVYLVIPQRWENSDEIKAAIESRNAETKVLFTGDFLEADRKARANVNVLHINLAAGKKSYWRSREETTPSIDPFELWFAETFPKQETPKTEKGDHKNRMEKAVKNEMVSGKNLIEALVALYNKEMAHLQKNYAAAASLDPDLMKELSISHDGLASAIKERIKGLKHKYWHEFFNNYESITERLTTASRKRLLDTLHSNTAVEFSEDNAYAITLWVIKNANKYYDNQLITLVEDMVRKANVTLYKSNKKNLR